MMAKPTYLGIEHATSFQQQGVAAAYIHRPPYPPATFAILDRLINEYDRLISPHPLALLDVGCGTGDLARPLAPLVERVDAVDFSAEMIAVGKALPGGDSPGLDWIDSPIETAPLRPPYALITAGESLHWMDWGGLLPRLAAALTERGYLAIVERETQTAWGEPLRSIIARHSTNPDYQPFDMVAALTAAGLFDQAGEQRTAPLTFHQPLAEYIAAFHSMSSLSRARMRDAAGFDAEVQALVAPYADSGEVEMQVISSMVWGKPLSGAK